MHSYWNLHFTLIRLHSQLRSMRMHLEAEYVITTIVSRRLFMYYYCVQCCVMYTKKICCSFITYMILRQCSISMILIMPLNLRYFHLGTGWPPTTVTRLCCLLLQTAMWEEAVSIKVDFKLFRLHGL